MASEKADRGNRRNAKRSTGPRTSAGKLTSSRNALRHGLSLKPVRDAEQLGRVGAVAEAIAADLGCDNIDAATQIAIAQLDLVRIRKARSEMLATIDLTNITPEELSRLAAVDRYERRALTRRRRATEVLAGNDFAERSQSRRPPKERG